ncbi:MAG: Enoyl-[acyl-carrier-protein] reductase [NADH] FabI [Holosporales bacterium]
MTQSLMKGKRGLIMGLANDYSLAYGISKALHAQGAELAFSYPSDALLKRIKPLAEQMGSDLVFECDVTKDGHIEKLFSDLGQKWGQIDFVLHSLAFADKNELKGPYYNTSKANFLNALDISCYSFTKVCKEAKEYMKEGGSLLTLTYYGAEKVIPNYNVMGVAKAALECSVRYLAMDLGCDNIRVNGISAGPVKTLAAMGISDFKQVLKLHQDQSPLKRNTTLEDVGGAGLYLLSDLSSGVTGEIHYVDSGYNLVGMCSLPQD